ncbi:inorganic phosphate transporter [Tsukamurella pseudospumae]|uniref:Phosphate transporter n=1 Tax=Tsukamurella pseudospumae TaxID=239498 RepID=A0A137ZZ82_9ACTN|nr:inorganic phosphate transporter [Tsukamurella pseudospumae]KXP03485.1 inorganic phosphate transporter [Tsukamurella pseudospumae]
MNSELIILLLVIVTALAFDFTNGFHDTGNAMATSIATGALKPKTAVSLSAILNLVGAFLSVEVALTVTNAVIKIQNNNKADEANYGKPLEALTADHGRALLIIVLAGLIGGIVWNLLTWLLGLPSSSSHALFGGLIGAALASGVGVVWTGHGKLDGVVGKVIMPALFAPIVAGLVAAVGTFLIFKIVAGVAERFTEEGFRWGQIGTASLVSLAHGTNDAQKTMGVITLALIAYSAGTPDSTGVFAWHDNHGVPFWVKVACAVAIALGTFLGGWRIIRTLGKGLIEISSPQGMAAEASSATIILASSHLGFALSTTHVATGSILGSGVGKPGAKVRWNVAVRMVSAWFITLPAAAVVGAVMWFVAAKIPTLAGPLVAFVILVALSGYMYWRAQQQKVDSNNVNAEWDDEANTVAPAAEKIAKV